MSYRMKLVPSLVAMVAGSLLLSSPLLPGEERTEEFQRLVTIAQQGDGQADADNIRQVIELGLALERPFETSLAVDSWLSQRAEPPLDILEQAAHVAWLAGRLDSAADRLRSIINRSTDAAEVSAPAQRLYLLLIDGLGNQEDAYRLLSRVHIDLRREPALQRYDQWLIDQALSRQDLGVAARLLAECASTVDSQARYGSRLHTFFSLVRDGDRSVLEHASALDAVLNAVSEHRLHPQWALWVEQGRFTARYPDFEQLNERGEEAVQHFASLRRAAERLLAHDARAVVINDVIDSLGSRSSNRWHSSVWQWQQGEKMALLAPAINRLGNQEKTILAERFLSRVHDIATPDQWALAGGQWPQMFTHDSGSIGDVQIEGRTRSDFAQMAQRIGSAQGFYPLIIRTLAQEQPQAMADYYFQNGYDINHGHLEEFWRNTIENVLAERNGGEISHDEWFAWIGLPYVAGTAMMQDRRWLTRQYFDRLQASHPRHWAERLRAAAWVPYQRDGQREVDRALRSIRGWIRSRERDHERDADSVDSSYMAAIPDIQEAMGLFDDDVLGNPDLAPNDIARLYTLVRRARESRDGSAFQQHGQALLEALSDNLERPFARGYWAAILTQPGGDARSPELLAAAVQQLVSWYRPDDAVYNQSLWNIFNQINHRRDWSRRPREGDRDEAVATAQAIAQALTPHLSAGHFWPEMWEQLSRMRIGRGWEDRSIGVDAARVVVEQRLLPVSPRPEVNTGVAYIELVREYFPELNEDFPYASAFDELFAAEAQEKNFVDHDYWRHSDDSTGIIRQTAARILAGYDQLPLAGSGFPATYRSDDYWNLATRVLDHVEGDLRRDYFQAMEGQVARRPDSWPLGRARFRGREVNDDEEKQAYYRLLNAYIDRTRAARRRLLVPGLDGLHSYGSTDDQVSDEELAVLQKIVENGFANWPSHRQGGAHVLAWLLYGMEQREDHIGMLAIGPQLWRAVNDMDRDRTIERYVSFATRMLEDGRSEIAGAWAAMGLQVAGSALDASDRGALEQVLNQARSQVAAVIPVDADDPRYGLFSAQAEWQVGRLRGAWSTYAQPESRRAITEAVSELRPDFLVWLVSRHVELEEDDEAEALVRHVLTAFERSSVPPPPDVMAELQYQRALISLMRREFPQARAQMQFITEVEEFVGTRQRLHAELMVADIDRETRNYDSAERILRQIARRPDSYAQARASFYQARLYVDRENWERALEEVQRGLDLDPTMVDAKLLEAEILFEMRLYRAVEDIDVPGTARTRARHIPGRPLTIRLRDDNRDLVGRASQLELIVRAVNSGDEERLTLVPLDEIGGAFQGTLPTKLGTARSGDRVLQVHGRDTIVYGLSPEFIERTNYQGDPETASGTLQIRTDGELYASSGEILTREEQAQLREEEEIRRALRIEQAGDQVETDEALAQQRQGNQVRPGSPINIRVIDPDASTSSEPNTIHVGVQATSGDRIQSFPLKETGEFAGVFEASLPTELLPAIASASDSAEGIDPNQALVEGGSGWRGRSLGTGARSFAVDLNQLRSLGNMRVDHGEDERVPQSIVVQTSLDGVHYTTVGIGGAEDPAGDWSGEPSMEMVAGPQRMPGNYADLRSIFDYGFLDTEAGKHAAAIEGGGLMLDYANDVRSAQRAMSLGGRDQVLLRVRAAFWVNERTYARFQPSAPDDDNNLVRLHTFINGERGREHEDGVIGKELSRGVHTIEIFALVPGREHRRGALRVLGSLDPQAELQPLEPEFFDRQGFDMLFNATLARPQAALSQEGRFWNIDFQGIEARTARLIMSEYSGDAPAIRSIDLSASDGERLLPLPEDVRSDNGRMVLHVVPRDQISVTYSDEYPYSDDLPVAEVRLSATFHDGTISAAFPQFEEGRGTAGESLVPVRRFEPGDTVRVFIRDNDLSVSPEEDRATFRARTSSGEEITVEARETGPYTGLFRATIFPVSGQPDRANAIRVQPGDDITLLYRDEENTSPGVAWDRQAVVEQVVWRDPQIRAYQTRQQAIDDAAADGGVDQVSRLGAMRQETIEPRYDLRLERPLSPTTEGTAALGVAAIFEIEWPTVAKHSASTIDVFVQTQRQRDALEVEGDAFDPSLPGTRRMAVRPSAAAGVNAGGLYRRATIETPGLIGRSPLDDGRFTLNIPLQLGDPPVRDRDSVANGVEEPLPVAAGDVVYVGFRYTDEQGSEQILTAQASLIGANSFEVMDQHYADTVEEAHVGERVYMRVIDPQRAVSSSRDRVSVQVHTESGNERTIELVEEVPHSGVFKGFMWLAHEEDQQSLTDRINSVPVVFGDALRLVYDDGTTRHEQSFSVFTGDDGNVVPFTKRFADDEMAVRTMFTLAEAHFEQAKLFREAASSAERDNRGREAQRATRDARQSISRGRRLLEEAIRDFPDTGLQAQAEYLLAELELEYSNDAENEDVKERHLENALARFTDIVTRHRTTEYAPRALYKKALVNERLGRMDIAREEYVKLSYLYPNHELVADTIARLGRWFLTQGTQQEEQAEALAEENPIEAERIRRDAREEFSTAANVFSKLRVRFPDHQLAARTSVLAGMCYMRAHRWLDAVEILDAVIEDPNITATDVNAEALYWRGDTFYRMMQAGETLPDVNASQEAYRSWRRLTWDYAPTRWARFANGRLSEPAMLDEARRN